LIFYQHWQKGVLLAMFVDKIFNDQAAFLIDVLAALF